jgi:hypothetical protein
MKEEQAVFVGYFPKLPYSRPDFISKQTVREICSVSTCISEGPSDWIDKWKHNDLGFFDSESAAFEVIPPGVRCDIYAYRMFGFRCFDDDVETIKVKSAPGDVPKEYQFLGYDIVTKSVADFFECSPLSCNHGANEFPVNEFCLVPDYEQAYKTLVTISKDRSYEPGPYYLFEVFRK